MHSLILVSFLLFLTKAYAVTSVRTIYEVMGFNITNSKFGLDQSPIWITSDGSIGVGPTTQTKKTLSVLLDLSTYGLFSTDLPPIPGKDNIRSIHLHDNGELYLDATDPPVSKWFFNSGNYLTLNNDQNAYLCPGQDYLKVHWGKSPSCTGSESVSVKIWFNPQ